MREVKAHAGFPIKPVYGPEDVAAIDAERAIGRPGEYPYTRGIHPHMYRDRFWTMRQYVGFGTPAETNERFKYLMAHGQDALNVAFDLPTQLGLDSDDPRAEGEVGRVGMAIDSLADMEEAFAGIPLDRVSVSLTINGMAAPITAMYYAVAAQQGAAADRVVTTPQNDILKEFVARGTWVYPVEPSLRLVADLIEFSARHYPRSNPVSVCGYHIREAGCTTAQEMAYGLAIAAAYVELMQARGMAVDDFAPRISFNFTCWGKIFEEVGKFRAGRRLYARMMRERFAATNPKSWMFRSLIVGEGSAHRAPHDADLRRGVRRGRHRRSAGRLLLRRSAHRRDGEEDPRGDGPRRAHGRHRRGGEIGHHPGRGRAPGLSLRATPDDGRDRQGRRELPRRRQGRRRRSGGRAVPLRSQGGRGAGDEARARSPRARWRRGGLGASPAGRRGTRLDQSHAGHHGGRQGVCHAGRDRPGDEERLRRAQGAREMVSAERFAKGMTFEQYVRFAATPENLAREGSRGPRKDFSGYLRTAYDAARLSPAHEAAWTWLVAQPGGPARVLAISEEWSSDCRRDIPVLAKLADTVGLDLRIFTR